MGVPKFYRWLSERYPLISQYAEGQGLPQCDHLYLDMNGIIHKCTHPDDDTPGTMKENDMFMAIFAYIDRLVSLAQPQQLIFMAIDGVAPRAKMNQQRSRRFRSAKTLEEAREQARQEGRPVEDFFDSNCITPGTEFMARLTEHLHYYIQQRVNSDVAWRDLRVILSGHEVPGEGEHKIMQYIRHFKHNNPDYRANLRHCIYGLDADLIFLALVSHEPHFFLLREEVLFRMPDKKVERLGRESWGTQQSTGKFQFLYISLLREYITLEFAPCFDSLPTPFNLERLVDDFVLVCFLAGNDFIPGLPCMDIKSGALNHIILTYKALIPRLGGYITDEGRIDLDRFEQFVHELRGYEIAFISDKIENDSFQDSKAGRSRRHKPAGRNLERFMAGEQTLGFAVLEEEVLGGGEPESPPSAEGEGEQKPDSDESEELDARIAELAAGVGIVDSATIDKPGADRTEGEQIADEYKRSYYLEKLKFDEKRLPEQVRQLSQAFMQGITWTYHYYFNGCVSWNWFFPFHYSPWASDLTNISTMDLEFTLSQPFEPYAQLLSVLPPLSSALLPGPVAEMMLSEHSPLRHMYPMDFEVDMDGKHNDWEGVVLLPFLDEEELMQSYRLLERSRLSEAERRRNVLGRDLVFTFDPSASHIVDPTLPGMPHVQNCCVRQDTIDFQFIKGERHPFLPRLAEGTRVGIHSPPGFPTLSALDMTPALENVGVTVFGMRSRKESLMLRVNLDAQSQPPSASSRCLVHYPFLREAIVSSVTPVPLPDDPRIKTNEALSKLAKDYSIGVDLARTKQGVDIADVPRTFRALVGVRVLSHMQHHLDGSVVKVFEDQNLIVPAAIVIPFSEALGDPRYTERSPQNVPNRFPLHSPILFTAGAHRHQNRAVQKPRSTKDMKRVSGVAGQIGRMGTVVGYSADEQSLVVRAWPVEGDVGAVMAKVHELCNVVEPYHSHFNISRQLNLDPKVLSKITGTCIIVGGKSNRRDNRGRDIGLNYKAGGGAREARKLPGYARFEQPQHSRGNGHWQFSSTAVAEMLQLFTTFPHVLVMLNADPNAPTYDVSALSFAYTTCQQYNNPDTNPSSPPPDGNKLADDIVAWLNKLPSAKLALVPEGNLVLSGDVVRKIEEFVVSQNPPSSATAKEELIQATPAELWVTPLRPLPLPCPAQVGERVISVCSDSPAPFGHVGTVVGVVGRKCEVLFDKEFPGGTTLHGRCKRRCGLIMDLNSVFNINHMCAVSVTTPTPSPQAVAAKAPKPSSAALFPHTTPSPAFQPALIHQDRVVSAGSKPASAPRMPQAAPVLVANPHGHVTASVKRSAPSQAEVELWRALNAPSPAPIFPLN